MTLVSVVLLKGTTTHFGPLYLSCVRKAEGMTIYAPMDLTLATMPLSVAVEMVSASTLKLLVSVSLCNDKDSNVYLQSVLVILSQTVINDFLDESFLHLMNSR